MPRESSLLDSSVGIHISVSNHWGYWDNKFPSVTMMIISVLMKGCSSSGASLVYEHKWLILRMTRVYISCIYLLGHVLWNIINSISTWISQFFSVPSGSRPPFFIASNSRETWNVNYFFFINHPCLNAMSLYPLKYSINFLPFLVPVYGWSVNIPYLPCCLARRVLVEYSVAYFFTFSSDQQHTF